MPKFSIKDLLIATLVIAVGLGMWVPIAQYDPPGRRTPAFIITMLCFYFTSCSIIGAGFGLPFKSKRRGAIVGVLIGLTILLAFAIYDLI